MGLGDNDVELLGHLPLSEQLDWRDTLGLGATNTVLKELESEEARGAEEARHLEESDVMTIGETCANIMTMIKNFNQKLDNMPAGARQHVLNMNRELSTSLLGAIPRRSTNSGPTLASSPLDDLNVNPRPPKVTFSGSPSGELPRFSTSGESNEGRRTEGNQAEYHANSFASQISTAEVLAALSRLDNRSIPRPEPFDAHSGQSFGVFLRKFEEFCSANYQGHSDNWTGELGRFLTGTMREVFEAIMVPGMSYYQLKEKLLRWHGTRSENIVRETKLRFRQASMRQSESLGIYAARLEKLFKLAYPDKNVEHSATLREKFLDTVPEYFRSQLTAARSMRRAFDSTDLTWSSIITFTCHCEEYRQPLPPVRSVPPDLVYLVDDPGARRTEDRAARPWDRRNSGELHRGGRTYAREGAAARSRSAMGRENWRPTRNAGDSSCFYCNQKGHFKRECRRYLGQCFACGSDDHRIASCPLRNLGNQPNGGRGPEGERASPGNVNVPR